MAERILIEEVQCLREDALLSTVVRREGTNTGLWVSTIPSSFGLLRGRNSFETRVFRFTGYAEIDGRNAKPNVDVKDDPKLNRWSLSDAFENNPESATEHHKQVAHEVADALESRELP